MLIGDKVRMLHGSGEGIIIRMDGENALVMLNEGIEIPVNRKHLVLVRSIQEHLPQEKKAIEIKNDVSEKRRGMLFLSQGLYLAGIPTSPHLTEFFLVNQSDYSVFVLVYKLSRPSGQFHARLELNPKSALPVPGTFTIQGNNHLTGLCFQFLKFHPDKGEPANSEEFRISFAHFPAAKKMQRIPILEKEGILVQMDADYAIPDAEKLKEAMFEKQEVSVPRIKPNRYEREIDLHMEKLEGPAGGIEPAEILDLQIQHFEKAMDAAMVEGTKQLIVIHGVGNGTLRKEIHFRLSRNRNIRYFRDARKEKFGYGATEIGF